MYYQQEASDKSSVKAMFVVPKKKFKHASDRNKLKRRIREAYRLHKSDYYRLLEGKNINVSLAFIYVSGSAEPYDIITKSVQKLLTLK